MTQALPIGIRLAPSLGPVSSSGTAEQSAFLELLGDHLEDLHQDLGLPPHAEPSATTDELPRDHGLPPFRVRIGDDDCRLQRGPQLQEPVAPAVLASQVAHVLHAHRALLVSAELAKELQLVWAAREPGLARVDGGVFLELLASLARRGYSTDRARQSIATALAQGGPSQDAAVLLERIVAEADSARMELSLGPGFPAADSPGDDQPFEALCALMSEGLFYEFGLRVPQLRQTSARGLGSREFRVRINDVRLPPELGLPQGQVLVNETPERLALLKLTGTPFVNPANGNACSLVSAEPAVLESVRAARLTMWGAFGHLVLSLSAAIRRNAGNLLTQQATDFDLRQLRSVWPDLIDATRRRFDTMRLTRIFRRLLEEGLSTRNLRALLQALLAIDGTTAADHQNRIVFLPDTQNLCPVSRPKSLAELDVEDQVNCLRLSMKRFISHKYTRGESTLTVFLLDPANENRLAQSDGNPLDGEEHERLLDAVFDEYSSIRTRNIRPVLLVGVEARAALRRLIEIEFPDLPVLCYQELSPEMNIQPVARISFAS